MKEWQAVALALMAAVVSAAIADAKQGEQPVAGDRRGNRCFNGRYWKECGTPDGDPPPPDVRHLEWRTVECYTNQCIADTLNRLPTERAEKAKLTTWKNLTYVWYQE